MEEKTNRDYYEYTNGYQDCINNELNKLEERLEEEQEKVNYLVDTNIKLKNQLQAYKDKEDKIKKYINAHTTILPLEYSSVDYIDYIADCEPILQILNEGETNE